jgi:hypothetical protein
MSAVAATPDRAVCAHCDLRDAASGEHLCMGFLFDWLEDLDGEHRMREFGELIGLMDELGI